MTVNFYIDSDKRGRAEKSVYCFVREQKQTIRLNTGERILPKHWDATAQKAKRSLIGSPEFNQFLLNYKEGIWAIIRKARIEDPFISFEKIKAILLRDVKNDNPEGFFTIFDSFIETRKLTVTESTTNKYLNLKKHIEKCCEINKLKVTFESIDLAFFDKLQSYFLEQGLSNNTIAKNIQFFIAFLRWACSRDYTTNRKFEDFKNVRETPADSIALTKEELAKIQHCTGLSDAEKAVRDVFLFQLYTGQRYSDILKFNSKDVRKGVWYLRQKKTTKPIEVPIIEPAQRILNKYKGKLPLVSNSRANEHLKKIGAKAHLDDVVKVTKYRGAEAIESTHPKHELLTTHTARRTFVSLLAYENVNQQVIKSYTGHGSDKLLAKYFKGNVEDSRQSIEEVFSN